MAIRNIAVQYDTDTKKLIFKTSNDEKFEAGASDDVVKAIADAITTAVAANKTIGTAISNAITASVAADKTIGNAITATITTALADGGAIKAAIDAAIAAIPSGG